MGSLLVMLWSSNFFNQLLYRVALCIHHPGVVVMLHLSILISVQWLWDVLGQERGFSSLASRAGVLLVLVAGVCMFVDSVRHGAHQELADKEGDNARVRVGHQEEAAGLLDSD